MKIRQGFVSNSSSSSFAIYGVRFETINDVIKECDKLVQEKFMFQQEVDSVDNLEFDDDYDVMEDLLKNSNILKYYIRYDIYIGQDVFRISDDQTLREFKEDILKELVEIFPNLTYKDIKPYEECWRDD